MARPARRWRGCLGRVVAAILLTALAFVAAVLVARQVYPYHYRTAIEREAARHGFDPLFVAAVIFVESRFDPMAVSPRGARGLMQLMPETASWVAEQSGLGPIEPDHHLFVPELNIRLGTWYLAELRRVFGGDEVLMLAAYNGGRSNVQRWARAGVLGEPGLPPSRRVEAIPFAETRQFVRRVYATYAIYRWLYRPAERWR